MPRTAQELYQEREQRIMNAIHLEPMDRIPIMVAFTYFPGKYTGVPFKAAWYDHDKWLEATKKTIVDYAPDGIWSIQGFNPARPWKYSSPEPRSGRGGASPRIETTRRLKLRECKAKSTTVI